MRGWSDHEVSAVFEPGPPLRLGLVRRTSRRDEPDRPGQSLTRVPTDEARKFLAAVYAFDRTRPGAYREFSYPTFYVVGRDYFQTQRIPVLLEGVALVSVGLALGVRPHTRLGSSNVRQVGPLES